MVSAYDDKECVLMREAELYTIFEEAGNFYFYKMEKDIPGLPDGRYIVGPFRIQQDAEDGLEATTASQVVHFKSENKKWYFWDETWSNRYGPFDSKEEADNHIEEYSDGL